MNKFVVLLGFVVAFLAFPRAIFAQSSAQTTNVTVVYANALPDAVFEDVTRFYFTNQDLMIDQYGTVTPIPMGNIRRLELEAVTSPIIGMEEWNENSIRIFPNPTSDKINFSSPLEQDVQVVIYSSTGQMLRRQHVSTSESVDVSALPKGLYIIRINEQTYKFSKL